MSKVVINATEKELARKQKQLAKLEREIDMWTNGHSYLIKGQIDAIEKSNKASKKGDYKKALRILEKFQKKKAKIPKKGLSWLVFFKIFLSLGVGGVFRHLIPSFHLTLRLSRCRGSV